MARSLHVDLDELLRSLAQGASPEDELTSRILDAAQELFALHGMRRCTIDDIAEHSGLGRTTVYRRFEGRSQLITAVLARECRRFFGSIFLATAHLERVEDAVVEGLLTGLRSAESSLLSELVRTEPEVLRLLTVDAGPIIAVAREFLVHAAGVAPAAASHRQVQGVAGVLVRLALSFVADARSVIALDDADRARVDLHALLDPILQPLAALR